ncbi:hypothetical protein AVEN_23172-1 [Araneus ventricosus]|nr:hypothetical protein AVEN_23172-1 [Araneus ventricosus]
MWQAANGFLPSTASIGHMSRMHSIFQFRQNRDATLGSSSSSPPTPVPPSPSRFCSISWVFDSREGKGYRSNAQTNKLDNVITSFDDESSSLEIWNW